MKLRNSIAKVGITLVSLCSISAFASSSNSSTKDKIHQGSPITSDNIVDVMEIQRTLTNLTDAADNARWDELNVIFADKVLTTIGEPAGGKPKIKPKAEIIKRWKGFFSTAKRFIMHHFTANERIYFTDKNNALINSKGVIALENTPAGAHAEEGGTLRMYRWINYDFGVVRTGKGWKVNKVVVHYLIQEADSLKPKKK